MIETFREEHYTRLPVYEETTDNVIGIINVKDLLLVEEDVYKRQREKRGIKLVQSQLSPMMQHYMETKKQYPDCVLFYRLGDFYEMFFDDALTVSKELEITLTGKECGLPERAPMCGVPFHAVDSYLNRLVQKGYKVAIAEMCIRDSHRLHGPLQRGK